MDRYVDDSEKSIKYKSVSGPSSLTNKITKIIPDPTNILMNPITFPIIITSLLLLYLAGAGNVLTKNPLVVGGSLAILFLLFIIVILFKKPTWQIIS